LLLPDEIREQQRDVEQNGWLAIQETQQKGGKISQIFPQN
jgi:hypothetical protein